MATEELSPASLHLDPEHTGLRLVVVLSLFVSGFLAFAAIRQTLRLINGDLPDYTFIVSCAGALPIALLTIWIVESVLKRTWHSGRRIELDQTGLTLVDQADVQQKLAWDDLSGMNHWTFGMVGYTRVGQERQLPKSWVCLASEAQVGEDALIVYTFLPRRKRTKLLDRLAHTVQFQEIDPCDVYETSIQSKFTPLVRPIVSDEVLAGENGRFWLSEQRRWQIGHELSQIDYSTFLDFVQQYAKVEERQETREES